MTCEACGHEQDRGRFCGRCGARVVDAAQTEEAGAAPRPRSRSNLGSWLAVLVVATAALAIPRLMGSDAPDEVVAAPQGPPDRSAVRPPSLAPPTTPDRAPLPAPLFGELTGTALLFDDGTEGALVLDLDTGETAHVEVPGQLAGDQPYRVLRLGSRLAVGRGEIRAVVPGTGLTPRGLGSATLALPAAEPGRLWLIDGADAPGERSASTWTLIDAAGEVVAETPAIDGYEPVRGVPGGLGLRDGHGILWRYDVATDEVVAGYGGGSPAWVGDVTPDRAVWCSGVPCRTVVVADATGAAVRTFEGEERFGPGELWLSPDGSILAAVVWVPVGQATDRRLRVRSVESGSVLADLQLDLGAVYGAWAPDGSFLAWIHAQGSGAPSTLARWDGGEITAVDVRPLGVEGVGQFLALPRHALRGGLARLGEDGRCPESDRSDAMGSLPAWRGDRVHVALLAAAPGDAPTQVWVGVEGPLASRSMTVTSWHLGDDQRASFRVGTGEWLEGLTVRGGARSAEGFPPHWGVESAFPAAGCWAVTVDTGELTETVVLDVRSGADGQEGQP